ncbi:histidine kinase [Aestuariivirga litoralis]|nr:histidine kinase [Aestuariivirga litoralis]MBG1233358.1 histidine kinase [Aestuariivirga litoralis]
MPDTFKFLLVIGVLAGLVYGGAFALASYPPSQIEITKALPHDRLRTR